MAPASSRTNLAHPSIVRKAGRRSFVISIITPARAGRILEARPRSRQLTQGRDSQSWELRLFHLFRYATFLDEVRETIAAIPRQIFGSPELYRRRSDFRFLQFRSDFEAHKSGRHDWKADTGSNARGTRNVFFEKLFPAATVAETVSTALASDLKTKLIVLR